MLIHRRELDHCLAQTLLVCICGFLFCIPVRGLDRDRTIAQFYHTAWTAKDGAPSQISSLTQTVDGYLWIGTERGLFRFDGVQFERYEPPVGVTLPSHSINSLMATPDGGLWMSFNPSGAGFLKEGKIQLFSGPDELPQSELYSFACDLDGRVWAGTHDGLLLLEGSRWIEIGIAWNFSKGRIWTMFVDRDGTLWVASDNSIAFLQRGSKTFQQTEALTSGVPQITQAKDGRLWITQWSSGPTRPLPVAGRDSVAEDPEIRIDAVKFLFDREGSLWMTGGTNGVSRVRFPERLGKRKVAPGDPELESFKARDGLSDNSANNVFEDREGNIWVSSNKGLDRFRHSHLVPVNLPPGYRDLTLLAGDGGDVWVASASLKPLLRIHGQEILSGSPAMEISSVYRDSSEVVWWGGHGRIWRQRKDQFEFFPQPKGTTFDSIDWLWEIIPDDFSGGLWVGLGDIGLLSFKDGIWTNRPKQSGLLDRVPSASYHDSSGRVWLGYTENRVYRVDGNHVQAYSRDDGIDIGRIRVVRGHGPEFWFGGELGLAVFHNGSFRTVRTLSGEPFGTVSGIVQTPDGALWLNELHGVVHISSEDVRKLAENPDHVVTRQEFLFLDGLPGAPQMNPRCSTAIEATDGRLWFATDNGLAWIAPAHISKNMVPPPVSIRSLDTEAMKYDPSAALSLPQGTVSLRIEYTAMSLSIPERVRFRYKLEGGDEDEGWQDAGTRRLALYNNLHPGKYRFRVIACNNDGIWNDEGAILDFSIAPAWYQTGWFRAFVVVFGVFVIWSAYRLRVRKIAAALSIRFDERLTERTRLARDLHDTLLQTIQASKIVADDALGEPTDAVHLRLAVERLSNWLGQAVREGRAALNSLRTSTTQRNDLAEALRQATEDGLIQRPMEVALSVVGDAREMHPIVRDEISRIGSEAIRNAFCHSEGTRLEIQLIYASDLILRVIDNGKGIDPVVAKQGKEGHFGIQGMHERAASIGGTLSLPSSAASGTEVKLVVPGSIVFNKLSRLPRSS